MSRTALARALRRHLEARMLAEGAGRAPEPRGKAVRPARGDPVSKPYQVRWGDNVMAGPFHELDDAKAAAENRAREYGHGLRWRTLLGEHYGYPADREPALALCVIGPAPPARPPFLPLPLRRWARLSSVFLAAIYTLFAGIELSTGDPERFLVLMYLGGALVFGSQWSERRTPVSVLVAATGVLLLLVGLAL